MTGGIEFVYMLTKTPDNYFDMDAIRRKHKDDWDNRNKTHNEGRAKSQQIDTYHQPTVAKPVNNPPNPKGRSPRCDDLFFDSLKGYYIPKMKLSH